MLGLAAAATLALQGAVGCRARASETPRLGTIRFLGTEASPRTTRVILRGSAPIEVLGEIRSLDRLVVLLGGIDAEITGRDVTSAPGLVRLRVEPGRLSDGRPLVRLRLEGIRKGMHSVIREGNELQVVLRDPDPGETRWREGAVR